MRCVICNGTEIENKAVQEEIRVGNDVVYVPIETLVCKTCGERYYDRNLIRFLENMEQDLKEGNLRLREVGKALVYEPA